MTAPDGPWPPRSKPRRVEGGIRARSTRGAIGKAWWSKRFLAVLESFAPGGRLTRGRSYARAGQVLSLAVAPGEVTASVQGSRRTPYQVRIGLDPLPALVWAKVEVALAEQAIYSARLLAGELPHDIEEVFAAAGASLFPGRLADLSLTCSCPDVAVPCKHLAATCYLLAEALDDDPFQLLHWRGRARSALLARLRGLRDEAGTAVPDPPAAAAPPVAGAALALAELAAAGDDPSRAAPDRFWLPPVPLPDRPPVLATAPDLLLRQLPLPSSGLGGAGLVEALRAAYQRFAAAAPPGRAVSGG